MNKKQRNATDPPYGDKSCPICTSEGWCREHDDIVYEPINTTPYCNVCQQLCIEHTIYGPAGRPTDVQYGRVFSLALNEFVKRLKISGDISSDVSEFNLDEDLRDSVKRATEAGVSIRSKLIEFLELWLGEAFSPYPEPRFFTTWDQYEELDGSIKWREFLQKFQTHKWKSDFVARTVAVTFAQDEPGAWKVFDIAWSFNPSAALLGIEAFIEAAALFSRYQKELKPPDFAKALLKFYVARHLDDDMRINDACADLIYSTSNKSKLGPLRKLAQNRYNLISDVSDIDREFAEEAFCDAFIKTIRNLPIESWLAPALVCSYALKVAGREGNKIFHHGPLFLAEEEEDRTSFQEVQIIDDQQLTNYQSMQDYGLALLREGGASFTEIGREIGISKQAVRTRYNRFIQKAKIKKHSEEMGQSCWNFSDELWDQIQAFLPSKQVRPLRGRPRMSDRQAMVAIFYILYTNTSWKSLPRTFGAASTVHDRFKSWKKEKVFDGLKSAGLLKANHKSLN